MNLLPLPNLLKFVSREREHCLLVVYYARLCMKLTVFTALSVKRRFVRQNREIARVNSIQSLRIRSLESEVSHLLSENVSLREQTISLNQELERYEAAKMLHDGVYDIKAKLDSKLAELGSLVTDLGALPRRFGKLCDRRAESTDPEHSRLSNLDWRRRATDAEYNATAEDGKLPVILEDKCYPRNTLEYVYIKCAFGL